MNMSVILQSAVVRSRPEGDGLKGVGSIDG